jgi:hypothetical protein
MDTDVLHYSDYTPSQHHAELQLADRPNVLGSGLSVYVRTAGHPIPISRSSYMHGGLQKTSPAICFLVCHINRSRCWNYKALAFIVSLGTGEG